MGFQPTLPHRERPQIDVFGIVHAGISTHAPAQGATTTPGKSGHCKEFQPTLPHRERRNSKCRKIIYQMQFQPTLPHRERPHRKLAGRSCRTISTHAPAQGATPHRDFCGGGIRYFNPRSRTGSDVTSPWVYPRRSEISTHAPAQGATTLS